MVDLIHQTILTKIPALHLKWDFERRNIRWQLKSRQLQTINFPKRLKKPYAESNILQTAVDRPQFEQTQQRFLENKCLKT